MKYMRWSAMLVVLTMILAACSPSDGGDASEEPSESTAASESQTAGGDPETVVRGRCEGLRRGR